MSQALPEVTYTHKSELNQPLRLIRSMLHDLLASRELTWRLTVRNLSAQYRQSMLGYVWAFLPPLVTALTFIFLNSQKIMNLAPNESNIPYPVYVLMGTLLWQGFVDALNSPLKLLNQSKSMLAKINFPHEALILAGLGEALFNFVIRLILLVPIFLWFRVNLPSTAWLAPLGIFSLLALGLMIGLLLAPIGLLYQDVQRSITIIVSMWLLLTPVVYPPPTQWPASMLVTFNPVSPLLVTTREMLTTGTLTQLNGFLIISGITFLLIVFGWLLYRLAMPRLIERMGS